MPQKQRTPKKTASPKPAKTMPDTEKPPAQRAENLSAQPAENLSAQPAENLSAQPAETPTAQPARKPAEKPAGKLSAQPAGQPAEKPAGKLSAQPAETLSAQPAEKSAQPAEKPAAQRPETLPGRTHPRDRLLETATELFYAQGVHAVGIDKIIAFAGVAKATFYAYFPGKDDLVRAYIMDQSRQHQALAERAVKDSPRETLLAIFEYMGVAGGSPAYRGCPFVNVAAEYPNPQHMVRMAVADHRAWLRRLFRSLLVADGHPDPERTAEVLMLVRDGLVIGLDLGDTAAVRAVIRDAVTRVLDAPAR